MGKHGEMADMAWIVGGGGHGGGSCKAYEHGHGHTCIWWVHVSMGSGWPEIFIHMHGCNMPRWHGSKASYLYVQK